MLDLILIILIIISLFKPDILLAKKVKEKASEEQKMTVAKNLRKIYATLVGLIESIALIRYSEIVGIILAIVFLVLFCIFAIPGIKENSKILKELD